MRTGRLAALVLAAALAATPAAASVSWHEWRPDGFQAAVDQAARDGRLVMLVVTQPDWCPPCIKLDRLWLKNASDTRVRDLTQDMVLLEVHGYDPPGAALLREQGVRFLGTPTTFVYRPSQPWEPLGKAQLLGRIVGTPDDWPDRLEAILRGDDDLGRLAAAVDDASGPLDRARALMALAEAHSERGDADAAAGAYEEVLTLREPMRDARAEEMAALKAKAELERAAVVDLRVRKDYGAALEGIDAWLARHRSGASAELLQQAAYARTWALAHLGREEEALEQARVAWLGPDSGADDRETFLYVAFRTEKPLLLQAGLETADAALATSPDDAALHQGRGRILRRLGRPADAEAAFARAVELAPDDAARLTYQGELDHVRTEVALAQAGSSEAGAPPAGREPAPAAGGRAGTVDVAAGGSERSEGLSRYHLALVVALLAGAALGAAIHRLAG